MKKNIKHFVCLVLLLIGTLGSKIFAVESGSQYDQVQEKELILAYKNNGLFEDGRDEEGRIKFKNEQGKIVWSSEHLDPQSARPSPESILWLAHNFTISKDKYPNIVFNLKVVSPSGTHGRIYGEFRKNESFQIWNDSGNTNDSMEDHTLARALDLALDHFSGYMGLDFKNFEIRIPRESSRYLVLRTAIEELVLEEKEKQQPVSQSIENKFSGFNKGADIERCDSLLSTLMRHPPLSTLMRRPPLDKAKTLGEDRIG